MLTKRRNCVSINIMHLISVYPFTDSMFFDLDTRPQVASVVDMILRESLQIPDHNI